MKKHSANNYKWGRSKRTTAHIGTKHIQKYGTQILGVKVDVIATQYEAYEELSTRFYDLNQRLCLNIFDSKKKASLSLGFTCPFHFGF